MSVVVRSMDRPPLERALRSIAVQAAPVDAEVIVVAACGPGHRPVPPRVGRFPCRLVHRGVALDRPRAGNAGLEAALGSHVTFVDDDDELLPNQFATLLAPFGEDPACGLVHARALAVDRQGAVLYIYGGPWVPWRQLTHGFFQLGAAMFTRDLVDRGLRFDENLPILEDLEFFVQCAQATTFRYVAEPVMRYHAEEGSSGTGDAANRDPDKMREPLAYIRRKWSALAERLEAMPQARLERAHALARAGRFQETWATLSPLVREGVRDVNVLNLCAMALLYLGNLDEARPMLEEALRMLPDHPGLLANFALLQRSERGKGPERG